MTCFFKDIVRRHCNSMRVQRAKFVFEISLETTHDSESNRYLLHWDGNMIQSIEHSYCYSLDCNS